MLHISQNESYRRDNRQGSTQGSLLRTMSHKSRPMAIRAQYQLESVGYLRLSLSKALHSTISLPHMFDQSAQLAPLVGEGTGRDTDCFMSEELKVQGVATTHRAPDRVQALSPYCFLSL